MPLAASEADVSAIPAGASGPTRVAPSVSVGSNTFAAYNVITAPKELVLALEMGHVQNPDQAERANSWLLAQVKK